MANAISTHKRDLQVVEKFTEARDQIPLKAPRKTTWRRAHRKLNDRYGVLHKDGNDVSQVGDGRRQGTGEGKCVFSVESSVAGTRVFVGEEPVVQGLGCQGNIFRALGLSFPSQALTDAPHTQTLTRPCLRPQLQKMVPRLSHAI